MYYKYFSHIQAYSCTLLIMSFNDKRPLILIWSNLSFFFFFSLSLAFQILFKNSLPLKVMNVFTYFFSKSFIVQTFIFKPTIHLYIYIYQYSTHHSIRGKKWIKLYAHSNRYRKVCDKV